jgi:hypothetical protein
MHCISKKLSILTADLFHCKEILLVEEKGKLCFHIYTFKYKNADKLFSAFFTSNHLCREDDHLNSGDRSIDGDVFNVQFSLRFPIYCFTTNCQNGFITEASLHIKTLYTNFSLSISFNNGRTFLVNLSFCSFDGIEVCQVNSNQNENNNEDNCANDDVEDVCAGYSTVCQTEINLCQDDCSGFEDVCQDNDP